MDVSKLDKVAIVSVSGAARLGRINEVLFATDPLRVAGVKATGDNGDFVVPIDRIRKIGPDAVMVDSPDVREFLQDGEVGLHTLSEIKRLKVVDEDGKFLGTVHNVEFEPESGRVEHLTAGTSGVLGLGGSTATIAATGVRSIGGELLTVAPSSTPSESERAPSESEPEPESSLPASEPRREPEE